MTRIALTRAVLSLSLSLALAACGGAGSSPKVIGPEGGTVTAPGVTLKIAPGAVSAPTEFQIVDSQPNDGAVRRIEIEPKDLQLPTGATLDVDTGDDAAGTMKMVEMEPEGVETEVEHAVQNEHHDVRHNAREGEIHHTGTFEIRHGATCASPCGTGEECDDGVCKAEPEPEPEPNDVGTVAGGPVTCPAGMELDPSDGICKPHGGGSGTGM